MDGRGHEAACLADQLTDLHMVALLHKRLGGSANMLRQRDDDPRRRGERLNGIQPIDRLAILALVGMDSPRKQT